MAVEVHETDRVDPLCAGERAGQQRTTAAHHEGDPVVSTEDLHRIRRFARHAENAVDRDHPGRRITHVAADPTVEIAGVALTPRVVVARVRAERRGRMFGPAGPSDGIDGHTEERERTHPRSLAATRG